MVLAERLDISSLPETLRGDFKQLNRLEGQYRWTSYLVEVFNWEDSSPIKSQSCSFCINAKEEGEKGMKFVEDYKPLTRFYKVILSE